MISISKVNISNKEELKDQIKKREELSKKLVGTLYPSVVATEIKYLKKFFTRFK